MFTFTRYSQQDPSWKNHSLGFNPSATIGSLGCLITDLAMTATGFGYNETPATLTEKIQALGPNVGFIGELVVPAVLPRLLPGVVYIDFIECRDSPAPMDRVDAALADGKPVIVEVDGKPAPGLQSHWVLLYEKQGNDYLMHDPFPFPTEKSAATLLSSPYAGAGTPARIINSIVLLAGPRMPPVNKPDGAVRVYAIEDGLALRSQPIITPDNLIKRMALLAELYSLEPVDDTLQKVGTANQWLNVQDLVGDRGYAAAWFLNTRPEVPGTPPDLPPAPNEPLVVYATADQLALRSQPEVSPETLIKRLPVNTVLTVSEESTEAARKVGVTNAWLKVKDPEKVGGFVAAWYVTLTAPVGLGPDTVPLPPPAPPAHPPAPALTVSTTVPSLALRSQPVILPETLIRRDPFGTQFIVTEPVEDALQKIGLNDQWLQVRDPADQTAGFIAAWFVKKSV